MKKVIVILTSMFSLVFSQSIDCKTVNDKITYMDVNNITECKNYKDHDELVVDAKYINYDTLEKIGKDICKNYDISNRFVSIEIKYGKETITGGSIYSCN